MNKAELNDLKRTDNLPQMIQKVKEDTQKYWSLREVKKINATSTSLCPLRPSSPQTPGRGQASAEPFLFWDTEYSRRQIQSMCPLGFSDLRRQSPHLN